MSKIDLEQMNKDLHSTECYKQITEIEDLLTKMSEINSSFTMNKAELTKRIAVTLFGDLSSVYSKEHNKDKYFTGLQNIINEKKELLRKLRGAINLIEKEVVFQEESLGSYHQVYKKTNKSE